MNAAEHKASPQFWIWGFVFLFLLHAFAIFWFAERRAAVLRLPREDDLAGAPDLPAAPARSPSAGAAISLSALILTRRFAVPVSSLASGGVAGFSASMALRSNARIFPPTSAVGAP